MAVSSSTMSYDLLSKQRDIPHNISIFTIQNLTVEPRDGNRTHVEASRTMLKDLSLGKDLCQSSFDSHIHTQSMPSGTLLANITPYEKVFSCNSLHSSHLHVFGLKVLHQVHDETWSKLDDKQRNTDSSGSKEDSIYGGHGHKTRKDCRSMQCDLHRKVKWP